MNWAQQLREVCRISEVVLRYCSISRRSGHKLTFKCPFHQEKTPSFTVDDTRNIFYCFGCKVGGDVIRFVQLIDKLDFSAACKKIAGWYGIELHRKDKVVDLQASSLISNWLSESLQKKKDVLDYLYARGITNQTITQFSIGWLGPQNDLLRFCERNSIPINLLESLGIKPNMLFLFENRIIFPIVLNNHVIGFGGRKFYEKDKRAKYINSSESQYFNKKTVLYGLDAVRNNQQIYIVEGYLDVCMSVQNNLNAVSTLGTAINTQHLDIAWSKCDEVSIWFDGDLAGDKAATKIALEAFSIIKPGKVLSFINMSVGEDPASFFQQKGNISELSTEYLPDKAWNILKPKKQKTHELSVAAYKKLLDYAKKITDQELRNVYLADFKNKWFQKAAILETRTKHVQTDPRYTYQLILLLTIVYYPIIFDYVCDYMLSMDLDEQFHILREKIVENFSSNSKIIDELNTSMLDWCTGLCTLQKLNKIAPFTLQTDEHKLVAGWLEVFLFYLDCTESREAITVK